MVFVNDNVSFSNSLALRFRFLLPTINIEICILNKNVVTARPARIPRNNQGSTTWGQHEPCPPLSEASLSDLRLLGFLALLNGLRLYQLLSSLFRNWVPSNFIDNQRLS